jgi:hypothetical protein
VVALENDLGPAVFLVTVFVVVPVLNGVRVQVGALRDGVEEEVCLWFRWGCCCSAVGRGRLLRDEGQLDRVEVVVACAALGELELEVDGGVGRFVVVAGGAEGLDRVDADLLVGDGDAALSRGAEEGEVAGRRVSRRWGRLEGVVSYREFTKRSTFCSTFSSAWPLSALFSGAVGADSRSAGKKGSLPRCDLGIQAFAPVAWKCSTGLPS